MSFLISYLIIGLVTSACLFADSSAELRFDPDSFRWWTAISLAFLFVALSWPFAFHHMLKEQSNEPI